MQLQFFSQIARMKDKDHGENNGKLNQPIWSTHRQYTLYAILINPHNTVMIRVKNHTLLMRKWKL